MKTTTIKLHKKTKERLDHLCEHKRETYDDVLQKVLEIMNICKFNPERARSRLIKIDRESRKNVKKSPPKSNKRKQKSI
jgi:mRNA-degrading endonuclease RelE of RelBE toxin-antitoxin system